jgi:hypothetical protein
VPLQVVPLLPVPCIFQFAGDALPVKPLKFSIKAPLVVMETDCPLAPRLEIRTIIHGITNPINSNLVDFFMTF